MPDDKPGNSPIGPTAYTGLFASVAGLRNGRAIAAMAGCAVVGVIVAGLLVAMGGRLGMLAGLLAAIVWFVAIGTGVNAAGILHMDTARGISPRGLVDAVSQGLMCIPKLIVLAIAVLLVEIVVFLAIAVLLFICKIPFLGPLLFTVVFPVSVVVAGVTVFGLFLGVTLSIPAIWQGATIQRAAAQTFAIVRSRLVEAVLLLLVVAFLSFAVAAVVFGVLGAGMVPTLGMSAAIVGFAGMNPGMGGMGGAMGMASGMAGGGYAAAGAIGGLVLWAVAVSLVAQVYLLGLCLVYLRLTEGLDLAAAEAALRDKLDEARRRAGELGEKARAAARPDSTAAASARPSAAVGGTAAAAGAVAAAEAASAASSAPQAWSAAATAAATSPAPAPAPSSAADPFGVSPLSEATAASAADIELPIDAPPPPATQPFEPAAALANCPQCMAPVTPDDVFCGVCGYRLR